jgi:hypothetical protein
MTTEERVLRLENGFATLAELVAQEKSRTDVLLQIVRDHDERSAQQLTWINELGAAQANADERIAALADAQIKTEEALAQLVGAQRRTDEALISLTTRIDRLAETVERIVEGRNGSS